MIFKRITVDGATTPQLISIGYEIKEELRQMKPDLRGITQLKVLQLSHFQDCIYLHDFHACFKFEKFEN